MAEITVTFNNQSYHLACRDGEEERLAQLAAYVDEKAQQLKDRLPLITDTRLLLMTSILIADELFELRNGAGVATEGGTPSGIPLSTRDAPEYERLLETAVKRVETLARSLENE
ncbi:cell division protein ZapA [Luteithermobacter gelatinilyticus]|uniref:cell division protein ZapA n=1 Tax=Luteithermobacter gelatinilyticus TaxID=2582913 RepID=UPI0011074374|nr:cell division protein ZapA [Luteithermobacter gelatinilyticus]